MSRPRTIVCDIDGVLFKHHGDITQQHLMPAELLPGALEKIKAWDLEGCHIILVSGRREGVREQTVKQLSEAGILYDNLVLGVGGGVRVLINDKKANSGDPTAIAINVDRNVGLKDTAV